LRDFNSEDVSALALVACARNHFIAFFGHALYKYFQLPAHPSWRIARFYLALVTIHVMLLLTDAILPELRRFHLGASRHCDYYATTQQNFFQSVSHFPK
jgi:hypothetical protein